MGRPWQRDFHYQAVAGGKELLKHTGDGTGPQEASGSPQNQSGSQTHSGAVLRHEEAHSSKGAVLENSFPPPCKKVIEVLLSAVAFSS